MAEEETESQAESEPAAAAAAEPQAKTEVEAGDEPRPEAKAEHSYEELKGMTVARMREVAAGLGDQEMLHGYSTMHKEDLLTALCQALGIEAHEHHEVVGIDKVKVKARIRDLKKQRDALEAARDAKQLKRVRRRIRGLKRKIRKATV